MPISTAGDAVAVGIIQQVYECAEVSRGPACPRSQPSSPRCTAPRSRYAPRSPSADVGHSRPKSSSSRPDGGPIMVNVNTARTPNKPDIRKKSMVTPPAKKSFNKKDQEVRNKKAGGEVVLLALNKTLKPTITVPLQKKYVHQTGGKSLKRVQSMELPDQDSIKRSEEREQELMGDEWDDSSEDLDNINEQDSLEVYSRAEPLSQLKLSWNKKLEKYEKMKTELGEKQREIMQLYAKLRNQHTQLSRLGEAAHIPPPGDLKVMTLNPDHLLNLCSAPEFRENLNATGTQSKPPVLKNNLSIDMNKLYNIPTNLVATCEHTLMKRQEIIDWLTALINSGSKGIKFKNLMSKINEFSGENEMMSSTLDKLKRDFLSDVSEISDYLRKGINESMALELKSEQLLYDLTEVNTQNEDLRKQIQTLQATKASHVNKSKLEELEKDLKEEKCMRTILRDRLTRAEGLLKISSEEKAQLEAALENSRTQTYTLERTVQTLHEQNKNLQEDFDKELIKLTKSIKENTDHLEEIADAREKLQAEKEELEKRLEELSYSYNESLSQVGNDMKSNISKFIETEKKCAEVTEEKHKFEVQVQSLCAKLLESELRYKDLQNTTKETENSLTAESLKAKSECMETKLELDNVKAQIANYKVKIMHQNYTIDQMQLKLQEHQGCESKILAEVNKAQQEKQLIINDLETKNENLVKQLSESKEKTEICENQVASLKASIMKIQQDFGNLGSLGELKEIFNEQRVEMQEISKKYNEVLEELRSKNFYIDQQKESLKTHLQHLEQKDEIIKMLSEKEEEHTNIVKLLRNNMEIRANVENDLKKKLSEKDIYIESLVSNLETRKQQISQLEKIVLTLEEQIRSANSRGREESEKIESLQKKIIEYETLYIDNQNGEPQVDNIDSLIKILEQELGSPYEQYLEKEKGDLGKKKGPDLMKRSVNNTLFQQTEPKKVQAYYSEQPKPTRLNGGNMKKTRGSKDIGEKLEVDSVEFANYGMFSMYDELPEPPQIKDRETPMQLNELKYLKREPFSVPSKAMDDKQSKMFKFAGHRL